MKIICSSCKRVIGIQRPFNDDSDISAKCPECFQKEKEEALKPQLLPVPGERKDITFKSGHKGYLTVADDATKLSINELVISGKTFTCAKTERDQFLEYLEMIEKDQVDITFLYSMGIKFDSSLSENYNCTVTVPVHYAISMFDDKVERISGLLDIVTDTLAKEWITGQIET